MLIDTHCHLDFPEFNLDRDEVIQRARNQGIEYIVNIGSSLKGSIQSLELARLYEFIYATVGIHPHEADRFNEEARSNLGELAKKDKIVGIGETGLDYYRNFAKADNQKALFIYSVNLAKDLGLPLVIHSRLAQSDTLEILKSMRPKKAVLHCFSQDEFFLKECLDLGFFISFTCNVTYKAAKDLKKLVKATPLSRLLLETDAPFLPPEGLRGKRNEPAYVKYLAEEVAKIKEIDLDEVSETTTNNARDFFGIVSSK